MPDGTEPRAILSQALREPFGEAAREWLRFLADRFPLWTFDVTTYSGLHTAPLHTTYPLRVMVESICADDGVTYSQLDPLLASIDQRRWAISCRIIGQTNLSIEGPSYPKFRARQIADIERLDLNDVPGFAPLSYEEIGWELVTLVEDVLFAPDKARRKSAQEELDTFLRSVEARLAPHRPHEGPPEGLLQALVDQGRGLIKLCWDIFPFEISDATRTTLAQQGVPDSEMQMWAARLALPVLSHPEIQALRSEAAKRANWKKGQGTYPTPQRFVIWVVAHRLTMSPTSLARVTLYTDAEEYFLGRSNPMRAPSVKPGSHRMPLLEQLDL